MAYEDYNVAMFEQRYRCYPVSFIEKPHLENGDKIIMPPSALNRLASLHIDYPMKFELTNPSAGRVSHCGVLEFIADEGMVYLPYWMMQNMHLQEGDIIQVKNTSLAKGIFVKLQPHTKDFLDVSNPKAVLEMTLRNYTCLTTGDTIMVPYNNRKYYIDIVETKPSFAITIIETDCEVDFAPPLDYVETVKQARSSSNNTLPRESEEEQTTKKSKNNPFTGSARRLDGKPATQSATPASSSGKEHQSEADNGTKDLESSTSNSKRLGKLVFGSNSNQPLKEAPKAVDKQNNSQVLPQKIEEPTFKAFTGRKYSLKD